MEFNTKIVCFGMGCALAGGVVGYLLSTKKMLFFIQSQEEEEEEILIQKTYEALPHLDRRIDQYVTKHSLREPAALKDLREMTLKTFPGEPMIIDPVEAQFFQLLLKTMNATKCIEVGAFTGYNAANMALALPDNANSLVVVCDITDEYLKAGWPFIEKLGSRVSSKLQIRIKPALETMQELIEDSVEIDFIFLDAEWKTCMLYYEKAVRLIRVGGIIAIDNTLCSGRVVQSKWITKRHHPPASGPESSELREEVQALHSMNKFIKDDDRVDIVLLKIADGVTLCRKR